MILRPEAQEPGFTGFMLQPEPISLCRERPNKLGVVGRWRMGFPNGCLVLVFVVVLADAVLALIIDGMVEQFFLLESARADLVTASSDLVRLSSSDKLSCVVFAEASCSLEASRTHKARWRQEGAPIEYRGRAAHSADQARRDALPRRQ